MLTRVGVATLLSMLAGASLMCLPMQAGQFHVSPTGDFNGTGSITKPWDLQTALDQPVGVQPGDTIWLHGGTYTGQFQCNLNGTANKPIIVKGYPGEWAKWDVGSTGDPGLQTNCSNVWFWGFEMFSSDPKRYTTEEGTYPASIQRGEAIANVQEGVHANIKFINMIIHDDRGSGMQGSAPGAELYGCILYYSGWQGGDREHGHAWYPQNGISSQAHRIRDNIMFGSFSTVFHAYASDGSLVNNLSLVGNVFFSPSLMATDFADNVLIGTDGSPGQNIVYDSNYTYGGNSKFGYLAGLKNVQIKNSVFVGGEFGEPLSTTRALQFGEPEAPNNVTNETLINNTIVGSTQDVTTGKYPGNTFTTNWPTSNKIFVRRNEYEPGRGHIVVYNFTNANSLNVDLSGVLSPGDGYKILDAQNYFGQPVVSGTYSGGTVSIPMTGTTMSAPVGNDIPAGKQPTHTDRRFGVFVITVQAPIGTLGAVPDSLPAGGGMVTLIWTSKNATVASIDRGIGDVPLNGDTTVQVSTTTTFTLALTGTGGTTTLSKTIVVNIPPVPPAPILTAPSAGATGLSLNPTLTWDSVTGATAYRLQVSTSSQFSSLAFDDSTLSSTSAQVAQLANNTLYYWHVRGKNAGGWGLYSSSSNFTTIPLPPSAPTLVSPADKAVNRPVILDFRWNAVSGATTYRLQVSTDSLFSHPTYDDSSVSTTSRQVSRLDTSMKYYWRVQAKNLGGVSPNSVVRSFVTASTTIVVDDTEIPVEYALEQNYPNPFNPSTAIVIKLPAASDVRLTVVDILGQEIARLVDGVMQAGSHTIVFSGSALANGVYFYSLRAGNFSEMRKMIVLK